MTRPLAWRDATAADDDAVVALVARLYSEDPSPAPVPREHTVRTLRALRESPLRGRAVVLDVGGGVGGYALLIAFWSNELGGEICEVDELYVVPEHRAQGHGSLLLTALAEGAGPWPGKPAAVALQVTAGNARARALYERLGFRASKNALMILRSGARR